jgi:4-hydroxybutyrate dehydrogenase
MATLSFPNHIEIDFGALKKIGLALDKNGIKRPLICTDKGIIDTGIFDKLRGVLPNDIDFTLYDETPGNPTETAVKDALKLYRKNDCDGIIAIGGGSSIDLGKGVSLTVNHDGPIEAYAAVKGGRDSIGASPPIIAIPTTAGTGSEVGGGAVIVTEEGHKIVIASPHLLPKMAICDPELTLGLPKYLTAATGMDAMAHCIEAYLTPVINPPAAAIGLDGLERTVTYLKRAVDDGSDKEARWHMMMAASEGAMAFSKGLGCVHSMSHAVGADPELKAHHGTLNAVLLPTVLRFNEPHSGNKYVKLRAAMGLAADADMADWILKFSISIGLPRNLSEMGVTEKMLPHLADHCMTDACHFSNPVQPTKDEYIGMYKEALVQ